MIPQDDTKTVWGVYGYEWVDGTPVDTLLRTFPTRARAERFAEPLSTCIVSAEVRPIPPEVSR